MESSRYAWEESDHYKKTLQDENRRELCLKKCYEGSV